MQNPVSQESNDKPLGFDIDDFDANLDKQDSKDKKVWFIPGSGIFLDIKRRLPYYFSDYYQGIHPKIIFSTFFMFFTSIAPALAFGFLLDIKTNQAIGVVEVLFSTALCGIIYAIISGQQMV